MSDLLNNNTTPTGLPAPPPDSLEELGRMSEAELNSLYRKSPTGEIPDGDSKGKAIFRPAGSLLSRTLARVAGLVWGGKVFDRNKSTLLNKIFGHKIIRATVAKGLSWFDDKESIIIDYKNTSLLFGWIRDEIREVKPGLYLGWAYVRLPFGRRCAFLHFALDFRK